MDNVIERIDRVIYGFDTSKLSADDMKNLDAMIDAKFELERQKKKLQEDESDVEPSEISILRNRWIQLQEARINHISKNGLKNISNAGLEEINKIYKKIENYQNAHKGR